ncbi:hypothetical protein BU15DRAFT_51971 [Melanogaster broomeanus]|nr:hypothetical protein BU15DRAFT_51971 [Melanogaster broomeanus]
MIVRGEYTLAMKAFEEAQYHKGAVVLGQPGIGKTIFLIYALVERLRRKQPTAFQFEPDMYILFTENGVTTHSANDDEPLTLWNGIWALSDSNNKTIDPAVAFLGLLGVRTIQATSPDSKRWKEWKKQYRAGLYIMDNWTLEELSALASVSSMLLWRGPSPRHLLDIFNKVQNEPGFQRDLDALALDFLSKARKVMSSLRRLDLPLGKAGPSSLIFIRPKRDDSGGVLRMECELYVPTARIVHTITKALSKQDALIRLQFFSATSSHASMRSTAGFIFEQWVHACFLSGVHVDCTWLNSTSKSLPSTLLTAQPSELISTNTELKTHIPPFYWRPVSINFPGIDGLLCRGDVIYAIQFTISQKHQSPLDGLRKLQDIIGKRSGLSWRVLFIGPSKSQATAAARPHTMLTESMDSEDSSKKRKRGTKYIPVGICELPIIPEWYDEEFDGLLEQLVRFTVAFVCGVVYLVD